LRRTRRAYADRRQLIASIVDTELADRLVRVPSWAGIHITALLRPEVPRTDAEVLELARRRGVERTLPVSAYAVTRTPLQGLVIGYGAVRTERIPEGFQRLRDCLG